MRSTIWNICYDSNASNTHWLPDHIPVKEWWERNHVDDATYLTHIVQVISEEGEGGVEDIVANDNEIHITRIHPMVMARLVEQIVRDSDAPIRFSLFQSLGHASDGNMVVVEESGK